MVYICKSCGYVANCIIIITLHSITTHWGRDTAVLPELYGNDNKNCLSCLLEDTMPLFEYYKLVNKGGGCHK